ncbi:MULTISPECIES: hypothetical protein [unclassified Bradyrhizobium]|uniref:hypothetical protein n=1 Tax=unclassified Bradyrhizobium TaxID=2631580 RepID=UPI0023B064D9|nr:hypothetical protein [Bradyrhizobium sp. CSS354]MDE5461546.1 hypothetical protein [Bradyrhizobium sp. CSS354]
MVTILVSVMGGVIVLSSKGEFKPGMGSRAAMAGALGALTGYAYFWIDQNITAETQAYKAIVKLVGNDKRKVMPSNSRVNSVSATLQSSY